MTDRAGAADGCGRCDGPLGWIDDRWVCGDGAAFCSDCRDELGGVCPDCSDSLRRERRTQPLRQKPPPSRGPTA